MRHGRVSIFHGGGPRGKLGFERLRTLRPNRPPRPSGGVQWPMATTVNAKPAPKRGCGRVAVLLGLGLHPQPSIGLRSCAPLQAMASQIGAT